MVNDFCKLFYNVAGTRGISVVLLILVGLAPPSLKIDIFGFRRRPSSMSAIRPRMDRVTVLT